jgi:hypothetical protein
LRRCESVLEAVQPAPSQFHAAPQRATQPSFQLLLAGNARILMRPGNFIGLFLDLPSRYYPFRRGARRAGAMGEREEIKKRIQNFKAYQEKLAQERNARMNKATQNIRRMVDEMWRPNRPKD